MATLMGLKKFIDYLLEKYPEFAEDYIAADHEKIYLSMPESEEEFNHLVEKAKEFGFNIFSEEDSIVIYT